MQPIFESTDSTCLKPEVVLHVYEIHPRKNKRGVGFQPPALEVLAKAVKPILPEDTLLVNDVLLPAVALFSKCISAVWAPELAGTKACVTPELFVIPVPVMVNVSLAFTVMLNALAPELNTIWATVALPEIATEVVLETSNVATSDIPLG